MVPPCLLRRIYSENLTCPTIIRRIRDKFLARTSISQYTHICIGFRRESECGKFENEKIKPPPSLAYRKQKDCQFKIRRKSFLKDLWKWSYRYWWYSCWGRFQCKILVLENVWNLWSKIGHFIWSYSFPEIDSPWKMKVQIWRNVETAQFSNVRRTFC